MIDLHTYLVFLATAVVLVITPGPDTILVLSRTVASGRSAGLMTLLGTQGGNVVHALLAGVSTIILLVPLAFAVLKVAGAVYLVVLAVMAWRAPATLDLAPGLRGGAGQPRRYFVQGLVNNLANPKMVAFFLALFPQFIHPRQGSLAVQSLVLGATLAAMAVLWIGLLVGIVGLFRAAVASSGRLIRLANRLAAITFLGLACRLALEENR